MSVLKPRSAWSSTNVRKAFTAGLLTLGLVLGSALFAPVASAGATGWDTWEAHKITIGGGPVPAETEVIIPGGALMGKISGKGLEWTEAGGYWTLAAAGNLCNWHMSVVFYEGARSKDVKTVYDQPNNSECARQGGFKIGPESGSTPAKEGSVCIRLYANFGDKRLASVCHSITK